MEQVRGDATPKVVGARSALDARGPSRGRPSARWSMRPGHNARRAEGRRWPRDASGKLRRCAASFTVTAQKRPSAGSPGHREARRAGFNGQLESRSRAPCVQHRNARPRPTSAAVAHRCRNGQSSELGFLMYAGKPRPSSPDCTLTEWSPRWFSKDQQTAPP
jgi:hypothetical protein